jgi:hypothetical protein
MSAASVPTDFIYLFIYVLLMIPAAETNVEW